MNYSIYFSIVKCCISSIITSFCIIFNICYMMNQQYYIYSRILHRDWISSSILKHCIILIFDICYLIVFHKTLNLITTRRDYSVFYNTLKHNHIILYHIWYLQNDKLPFYIYIPEYSQYWFQHAVINLITTRREFI